MSLLVVLNAFRVLLVWKRQQGEQKFHSDGRAAGRTVLLTNTMTMTLMRTLLKWYAVVL